MPAIRSAAPIRVAISAMLALVLTTLGLSCAPDAPEVDKAALYTPESLANELALRYIRLNPDAKTAAIRYRRAAQDKKDAERLARVEQAKNKAIGGAPAKKKQSGPPSLDDLLADIDVKLGMIKGTSRPDACRKMVETITADPSLSQDDKKRLAELIGKLNDAS